MDEVVINYKINEAQKKLSLVVGVYFILYAGYHASVLAMDKVYDFNFYLALIALVLGLILVLKVTVFVPRPVFRMNSELIYSNVAIKSVVYKTKWTNIKNIAIGLSYLKITESNGKEYNVDLSGLKYEDLKEIKSKIIEYCESKIISYQND